MSPYTHLIIAVAGLVASVLGLIAVIAIFLWGRNKL